MRRLVLFIATSLDGYIAGPGGEIDWLFSDQDYGYREFFAGVDTVLMGRKTWELSLTFGEDVYEGRQQYVFTRTPRPPAGKVTFVSDPVAPLVGALKQREGGTLWLIGGAQIAGECVRAGLIDEYRIFVHPLILGAGIALFPPGTPTTRLRLTGSRAFDTGLMQLDYMPLS
jgi:dihydrofolate reductase